MANFAIVGATGVVGTKMIERLGESNLRVDNIYLMASARSAGKVLQFRGQDVVVEELNEHSFDKDMTPCSSAIGANFNEVDPPAEKIA